MEYANNIAMGNALADDTDTGGGVVLALVAKAQFIVPEGLDPTFGAASLSAVTYSSHPIMNGVVNFNGGYSSFRPTTTSLNSGGRIVAQWTDGKTLAAVSTKMLNRVDLGFFPPSSSVSANHWQASGDGAKLMDFSVFVGSYNELVCP